METNLNYSENKNKEEAWIEKYRAALTLNSPESPSGFKKFRNALSSVHDDALSRIRKSLDRWVRAYRQEERQNMPREIGEKTPREELKILAEGMERVELLRRQYGKKAKSTTAWPNRNGPTKHIA